LTSVAKYVLKSKMKVTNNLFISNDVKQFRKLRETIRL